MEWRFGTDVRHYKLEQIINTGAKMNITQLCKETGFVHAHLSIVFDWWQECGLIERNKEGQDTFIKMTEFGKEVFKAHDNWAKLANKAIKNREKLMEKK